MSSSDSSRPHYFLSWVLHLATFLSGFLTMALEMLIGRTLIPYFGGTIYTWGALISIFLLGMASGYTLGGIAADRKPSVRTIGLLFFLGAGFILLVPVLGEPAINRILDSVEDVRFAALLASLALACVPAALLAAVSPYCVRLLLDRQDESGTIAGRMSGLATAGCIVGTLGTSFFLIPTLGVTMIYTLLGGLSVAMSGLFLCLPLGRRFLPRPNRTLALLPVIVAAVLTAGYAKCSFAETAAPIMRRDGVLEKVDSEYNTILVEKQGTSISMLFGYRGNRYTESVIDLANRDSLVVPYTRYMSAALAFREEPVKRIALVGLGGGRTISYLLSILPGATADVAELDPAVITLAKKYFGVQESGRLRLYNNDGRVFLNRTKEKYDLVLLDAYRGPFVPFHLTTKEFYEVVKSRLTNGGVVVQNVEPTTMFFDSAYVTMKSVFGQTDAFEADGNIVLVGYGGSRLSDVDLQKRAAKMQETLRPRYDLRELVNSRTEVRAASNAKVLTDDFAPVEMLKTIRRHNEKRR